MEQYPKDFVCIRDMDNGQRTPNNFDSIYTLTTPSQAECPFIWTQWIHRYNLVARDYHFMPICYSFVQISNTVICNPLEHDDSN